MVENPTLYLKHFNIAVPTAFYDDESLNIAGTLAHIQHLEAEGMNSFLLCGSTGEQHSLSLSEKISLLEALVDLPENPTRQILFGVASIRQKEAVELATKVSESKAVTGILLAFSPYIRPTQEEAYHYAIAIIEATGKPTLLYNNPLRTGFDLSVESIIQLSEHPLVEGVKDPGDEAKMTILKEAIQKPFHYLAGGEVEMLQKFSWGYNGLSSVRGNLFPKEVYAVVEAAIAGNLSLAAVEDQKLQKLMEPFMTGSVLVKMKKALNEQGIDIGICRSPLGN